MNSESARRAGAAAICAFAASVPLSIAGANISWGLLAAALLAMAYMGRPPVWNARFSIIEKPLWAFIAASILASALGTDPAHSFRYTNQDVHKIWIYYLFTIGMATIVRANWRPWVAAGFTIAALIGIWQSLPAFLGLVWVPLDASIRAHAFVHAVTFGEQIAIALLGGLAYLTSPDVEDTPRLRFGATAFTALMALALMLSQTRAAILSAFVGATAILILQRNYRKLVFIAIPLAILGIVAVEVTMPQRGLVAPILSALRTGKTNNKQLLRLHLWDGAVQMAADRPLTGVGHNNYRTELPKYVTTLFDDGTKSFGTAHNLYIHHLAERGLIGLAALFWLLGAFLLQAWRRCRDKPTALNLWALGTTVAFLVQNMTEVALQVEILWMLVFFIWILSESSYTRRFNSALPHDDKLE